MTVKYRGKSRSILAVAVPLTVLAIVAPGAGRAAEGDGLWPVYEQSLKGAKYVDLTHTHLLPIGVERELLVEGRLVGHDHVLQAWAAWIELALRARARPQLKSFDGVPIMATSHVAGGECPMSRTLAEWG